MFVKAMTFNIQHTEDYLHGGLNPELIANTIKAFHPDFCVLNEVFAHKEGAEVVFENQTELLAQLSGMPYYAFCPALEIVGSPYGNAFLALKPFKCQTVLIPDPPIRVAPDKYYYETRCAFRADFGDYSVIGSHFGLAPDEKLRCVQTVCDMIDNAPAPVLFCGDLNMRPDDNRLESIRDRLQDTADAFVDKTIGSFPSDAPEYKIDYIFADRRFKVLSADIPPVTASDHRPYIAELEL